MKKEYQQFVDAQFSKKCADSTGGAVDYDPFENNRLMPVMEDPEPTYIWEPETDRYYLEQCNSMNPTLRV